MALIVPHGYTPLSRVLALGEEAFGYEPDDPRQDPEGDLLARLAAGRPRSWGLIVGRYDDEPLGSGDPALGTQIEIPAAAWVSGAEELHLPNDSSRFGARLRIGNLVALPLLAAADADMWLASMQPAIAEANIGTGAVHGGSEELNAHRTGLPGRPTSKYWILAEFRRRIEAGQALATLGLEAAHLVDWLRANHPDGPSATVKSVENLIRSEFNSWKATAARTELDRPAP